MKLRPTGIWSLTKVGFPLVQRTVSSHPETRISAPINYFLSARSIEYISTPQIVEGWATVYLDDITFGPQTLVAFSLGEAAVVAPLNKSKDQGNPVGYAVISVSEGITRRLQSSLLASTKTSARLSVSPEDFADSASSGWAEITALLGFNFYLSAGLSGQTTIPGTVLDNDYQLTTAAISGTGQMRAWLRNGDMDPSLPAGYATSSADLTRTPAGPPTGAADGVAHVSGAIATARQPVTHVYGYSEIVSRLVLLENSLAAMIAASDDANYAWLDVIGVGGTVIPAPPPTEHAPGRAELLSANVMENSIPESGKWSIGPSWDSEYAHRVAVDPNLVASEYGSSSGVSKVLRQLLATSGISHLIISEIRGDVTTNTGINLPPGDHRAGNAIDVSGPTWEVNGFQQPTLKARTELERVASWVRQYPQLFTMAVYESDDPSKSIRIVNGKQLSDQDARAAGLQMSLARDHIHLATAQERLQEVLNPAYWNRSGGEVRSKSAAQEVNAVSPSGDWNDGTVGATAIAPTSSTKSASRVANTRPVTSKADIGQRNKSLVDQYPPVMQTDIKSGEGSSEFNRIVGVVKAPSSFVDEEYRDGLVALTLKNEEGDSFVNDTPRHGLAFHVPVGISKGYKRGWIEEIELVDSSLAIVGAQDSGEYVYVITRGNLDNKTWQTGYRANTIDVMETRFEDSQLHYDWGSGSIASTNTVYSFDIDEQNAQLHVSDEHPAGLWFLSGNSVGYWLDDGTPWAWHSVQNAPLYPPNDWHAEHSFRYGYWNYYQQYEPPQENSLLPTLVHPWDDGPSTPPELWWFSPKKIGQSSKYSQTLTIQKQTWADGEYLDERGFTTKAGGFSGGTLIVDPECANTDNKAFGPLTDVGTVGPFQGMDLSNPIAIRVVRDRKRRDRLWLVALTPDSVYQENWDGAWFCLSNDNGKTWGRAHMISPSVKDRGAFSPTYRGCTSVAMNSNGDILVPLASTLGNDVKYALAIINYAPSGIGGQTATPVVFRQEVGPWGL